jgi:hypothetical protein
MDSDQTTTDLYSVSDAGRVLGITQEAVRARLNRGTLTKVKLPDGSVMVRLDSDQMRKDSDHTTDSTAHQTRPDDNHTEDRTVEESLAFKLQQDQIEFLRRELERKDTIIMQMAQRIPELEAASEPRGSPEKATEDMSRGAAPEREEEQERPSWWRRWFGL